MTATRGQGGRRGGRQRGGARRPTRLVFLFFPPAAAPPFLPAPPPALHVVVGGHLLEAHLREDLAELRAHLRAQTGEGKTAVHLQSWREDGAAAVGCRLQLCSRHAPLNAAPITTCHCPRCSARARALSSGCRWPPGGARPSASKLYSLNVSSRQLPLQSAELGRGRQAGGQAALVGRRAPAVLQAAAWRAGSAPSGSASSRPASKRLCKSLTSAASPPSARWRASCAAAQRRGPWPLGTSSTAHPPRACACAGPPAPRRWRPRPAGQAGRRAQRAVGSGSAAGRQRAAQHLQSGCCRACKASSGWDSLLNTLP